MVRGFACSLVLAVASAQSKFLQEAVVYERAAVARTHGGFELQCQSKEDYGWPRFQSRQELLASPWASYFVEVYGELPAAYPVCVYDFWNLNMEAWKKAALPGEPKTDLSDLVNGDLYFTGAFLMIYHDSYQAAPDNTWIEVSHSAFPSELSGMWCWRTRGSGVWFNTGKTITFPTPADNSKIHQEAIKFLTDGCSVKVSAKWPRQESDIFGSCAREKGYDSIQFEPQEGQKPLGTFGQAGLTELVITGLDGRFNCGTEDAAATTLRSGWQASSSCDCENRPIDEHCGLMPRAPFPMSVLPFLVDPPLCEAQHKRFWEACDPNQCSVTSCKVRNATEVLRRELV